MVKVNKLHIALLAGAGILLLSTATAVSIPKGAEAVKPFDINRYLGKWYEIARLDFKYEKNLNNVTATYSLRKDGSVNVDNTGYNYKTGKWKESIGKAKFVKEQDLARLKVSFFGPFFAGYNVIAIDEDYRYALVAGNNLDYMWILSREKTIPESIKADYLQKASAIGYDIKRLVWTEHNQA